jgi:O-antigen ligase
MNSFTISTKQFSIKSAPGLILLFALIELILVISIFFGKLHYLLGGVVLILFAFFVMDRTIWGLYFLPIALATPIIIIPGTKLHLAEAAIFFILCSLFGNWALTGKIKGISFPREYKWALVLFFSAAFLSLLNAPFPTTGITLILKLTLAFVLVFGLVYNYVVDRTTLKKMILMIILAGLIAAFYGLLQYYLKAGTVSFGHGPRILGRAGGGYGAFIGIAIIMTISSILMSKSITKTMLSFFFLPPLVLALLLSRTRAWIFGTIVAIVLVFFLWAYKNLERKKFIIIFFVLILLCLVFLGSIKAIFLNAFSFLFLRQGHLPQTELVESLGKTSDLSLVLRYRVWNFAFTLFLKYPLTGIGVGNFRIKDAFRPQLSELGSEGGWSDNHYVNILVETGIIGAMAWTYLFYLLFSFSLRILKSGDDEYQVAALGLIGSLIIFAVGGFFWNLTSALIDSTIFVLIISLIFSTKKVIDQNESD